MVDNTTLDDTTLNNTTLDFDISKSFDIMPYFKNETFPNPT